jgi:arylsulfatase A-like enzyme
MNNRPGFIRKSILTGVAGFLAISVTAADNNRILPKKEGIDTENSSKGKANKPNIIFLMTDQQRWDAIGINNPHIKTPNLDRLARQGILFNQATCQAPMCTPSRYSMMLGLYPSQLGIRSNGSHPIGDANLPCDPLPERLKKAGYQTAGFGKTHWGRTDQPIGTRGFETRVVGAKEVGQETGARYQDDENPEGLAAYRKETANYGPGEEGVDGFIGKTSDVADRDHRDGWVAEKCLEFLDEGMDPSRPLFLYLSFLKPHAGLNAPKRFVDMYNINDIPDTEQPPWLEEQDTHLAYGNKTNKFQTTRYLEWRAAWTKMTPLERRRTTLYYYANCSWLDDYFGQALAKLEKSGRLKNALIVFTSDHGEMLGERHYRFTKYCLYDSSVRVPILLSGSVIPEVLRGTVDNRPAELVDLYPTLANAAGTKHQLFSPGLDLLSDQIRKGSFCEYHDSGAPAYMWRTKKWKLILFSDQPLEKAKSSGLPMKGELYDLENDPHEWNNLYNSKKHQKIREQLKTELLEHIAVTFAGFPVGKG